MSPRTWTQESTHMDSKKSLEDEAIFSSGFTVFVWIMLKDASIIASDGVLLLEFLEHIPCAVEDINVHGPVDAVDASRLR